MCCSNEEDIRLEAQLLSAWSWQDQAEAGSLVCENLVKKEGCVWVQGQVIRICRKNCQVSPSLSNPSAWHGPQMAEYQK